MRHDAQTKTLRAPMVGDPNSTWPRTAAPVLPWVEAANSDPKVIKAYEQFLAAVEREREAYGAWEEAIGERMKWTSKVRGAPVSHTEYGQPIDPRDDPAVRAAHAEEKRWEATVEERREAYQRAGERARDLSLRHTSLRRSAEIRALAAEEKRQQKLEAERRANLAQQ